MASYNTLYTAKTPVFHTQTTAYAWHGGWDVVAVRANITPAYNPVSGQQPFTPDGTSMPLFGLVGYKAGGANRSTNINIVPGANPQTRGLCRFLSDPLEAQTFGGTVQLAFQVFGSAGDDVSFRLYLAVMVGDTDVVRGVLCIHEDTIAHLWPSAGSAGADLEISVALVAIGALAGDRLLGEVGAVTRSATTTQTLINYGSVSNNQPTTDVVLAAFGTNRAPFFTFSQAVVFQDITLIEGDLIVGNSDIYGYDHTTGALKFVKYSIGSDGEGSGVGQSDGSIWIPHAIRGAEKYDINLNLLSTVAPDNSTKQPHVIRRKSAVDTLDTIYVGNPNKTGPCDATESAPVSLTQLIEQLTAGAETDSWAPANEYSGVPTFSFIVGTDTVLYTSLGPTVKSYDLATDTQNADVVSLAPLVFDGSGFLVSGTFFRGIRCLSDGTFLVVSQTAAGGVYTASDIRRYSAVGALLNTYTVASQIDWGTLALTVDELSFWVASRGNGLVSDVRINRINIATGAVEITITGDDQIWDSGTGAHLCSGGLFVMGAIGAPPATGTLIVQKVTDPSDATEFDINVGGGLIPAAITLADGESETYLLVPAGSGYSVAEVPNSDYVTSYNVSNGSPVGNISVGAGETVIVTITNSRKGSLLVIKMTDPLNTTHVFEFTAGGGLSPATFDLLSEETQLFEDLDPGTYSIVEDIYANFVTSYLIDNDPTGDNLNINIGPGENVSVGVLNQAGGKVIIIREPDPNPPVGFPPGTGRPFDTVIDNGETAIDWFAITALVRDL